MSPTFFIKEPEHYLLPVLIPAGEASEPQLARHRGNTLFGHAVTLISTETTVSAQNAEFNTFDSILSSPHTHCGVSVS